MKSKQLVLGVDGGGTKTVCWIAPRDSAATVLGRGRSGGSNPRTVGFELAYQRIQQAVDLAFADAGMDRGPVAGCVLGLAGAGRPEIQDAIATWANRQALAERVRIVPDYELVLAAGAPDGIGIGLIAGTGSLAFGRNRAGATARAGGWGYLLSDDGSGFAIGREAVRQMLDRFDAGVPIGGEDHPTLLDGLVLDHFDAADPAHVVASIYASEDPRLTIAQIAKCVTQATEQGDAAAQCILGGAADDLARLVLRLVRRLGFERLELTLAVTGGVLTGSPGLRETLLQNLVANDLRIRMRLVSEPVAGAVALAVETVGHAPR